MFLELIKNYLPILGVIITALFGLMSMYFYFKSKVKKNALVIYNNSVLQTKSHPDVIITYKNEQIDNLSKLQLLFFNSGQIEIRSNDIPTKGGLCLKFVEETKILSSILRDVSVEAINFELNEKSDNEIELFFDYLNPGDGAIIEILYDITENRNQKIKTEIPFDIIGSIIGVNKINRLHYSKYKPVISTIQDFMFYVISSIALLIFAIYLFKTDHYIWGGILTYLSAASAFTVIRGYYIYIKHKIPPFALSYFQ